MNAASSSCLHEIDLALAASERSDDSVDAVAWIAVDAFDTPFRQPLDEKVAYCFCHRLSPVNPANVLNALSRLERACVG